MVCAALSRLFGTVGLFNKLQTQKKQKLGIPSVYSINYIGLSDDPTMVPRVLALLYDLVSRGLGGSG